jgi:PAS domain S-box-containing protein
MLETVKVPSQFEPIFAKAQEYVGRYFSEMKRDPSKGTIEIFGQRYVLIRAASMSVDFFAMIKNLYRDAGEEEANNVARSFLFDIAHAIGKADAKNFHEKMNLKDPIEKLSAGPIHFAYSGWAFVDIFPESNPSPDENYYLVYDHPFSFESDAWEQSGKKADFPVCIMNSGYSSGWCEESFGITLVASEILCKAKGDEVCRFIMAPPSRIEQRINEYLARETALAKRVTKYEVPGFFKRKQTEEKLHEMLRASEANYQQIFNAVNDAIFIHDAESGAILEVNQKMCDLYGYSMEETNKLSVLALSSGEIPYTQDQAVKYINLAFQGRPQTFEWYAKKKSGELFWVEVNLKAVTLKGIKRILAVVRDITEHKKAQEELDKKMQELEEFHDLAVGREIRMIELEKELEELKQEIEEKK